MPSQWVLEVCQVSAAPHWDMECWTLLQCYLVVRLDPPDFFFFFLEPLSILQNIQFNSIQLLNFTVEKCWRTRKSLCLFVDMCPHFEFGRAALRKKKPLIPWHSPMAERAFRPEVKGDESSWEPLPWDLQRHTTCQQYCGRNQTQNFASFIFKILFVYSPFVIRLCIIL